jgi:hypothetical protein
VIRPLITDQDGVCLIGVEVRAETLTDGAADWLAGGGSLTTDAPLCLGGQGRDLDADDLETTAYLITGLAVCTLGAALGLLSVLIWPA